MANEWTTEYPTEPGYYWIRNYLRHVDPKWQPYEKVEPGPDIVQVQTEYGLEYYWTGSEVGFDRGQLLSAEWLGPIQPPTEPQQDYRWHHALQQARCRYPGGCDRAMQWINGYCDEHKTTVANLIEQHEAETHKPHSDHISSLDNGKSENP